MVAPSQQNTARDVIQLVIPNNSWALFEFLLVDASDEAITHQQETRFHRILWHTDHSTIKDRIREIASSITRRIEGLNKYAAWLGTFDEKIPRLASDCGMIIGEHVASILRGYFHCPYIGELSTDDESSLIPFYRIHDPVADDHTTMVGRVNESQQAHDYCQERIGSKRTGVIHVTGLSGAGKSLFARTLCEELRTQGWKVRTDRYFTDNRGGDSFAKASAKGQDPGIRLASIKEFLRQDKQPSIWWIDDGHWMPQPDQDFINHLHDDPGLRCIFLVTTRSEEKHHFGPNQGLSLTLENFTETETGSLIRTLSGLPASENAIQELQKATEGAPLVTAQVILGWLDSGLLRNQGGQVDITEQQPRKNSITEIKKVIASQLIGLPEDQAQALCVLALIRSAIDYDALEDLLDDFGINLSPHQIPLHHFYRINHAKGEKTIECRHETIRIALLSFLTKDKEQCHEAALAYELGKSNWAEAYHHSEFLGHDHQQTRHETLRKAYDHALKLGQLEQVRMFGQAIFNGKLVNKSDYEFHYQMGRTCYLLGEMKEADTWLLAVVSSNRSLPFFGIAIHIAKPLRKRTYVVKKSSKAKCVIDAYLLRADILWIKQRFYQSAACLLNSWFVSGLMPYPCAARSETMAGMALITSATPLIKIRDRFIRNGLNESCVSQNEQREMRARLLLAMALMGTERWQQAHDMLEPSIHWAKSNNDVKLQLQTGLVLCAIHYFTDNREEVLELSLRMTEIAKINTDRFLEEFARCASASYTANFRSNSQGLRMLTEKKAPSELIPECSALLAALYYSAEDNEEALKYTRQSIEYFCKFPPVSYGMVPLHEHLALVSIGLWAEELLDFGHVRKFMSHFKKQAKAFTTSRAIYCAWQAVAEYCTKPKLTALRKSLDAAYDQAQQHKITGHQATISMLQKSFGFPSRFEGAPKTEELQRIGKMVNQLKNKTKT